QTAAEQVAAARPQDPDAAILLARSLRARGETDRARRELTARLRTTSDTVPMLVELGRVELAARRSADARVAFERALAVEPSLEDARVGAIAADLAAGDRKKARARVTQWLAATPNDAATQVLAARVDLAEGADAGGDREVPRPRGALARRRGSGHDGRHPSRVHRRSRRRPLAVRGRPGQV